MKLGGSGFRDFGRAENGGSKGYMVRHECSRRLIGKPTRFSQTLYTSLPRVLASELA